MTDTSTASGSTTVSTQGTARFAAVFAVVTAGIAMVNLDLFIVNVALPSIGKSFGGADLASLSWVLNAYAIVFAALLVPAGRAADLIGRRTAFLAGVIVFALRLEQPSQVITQSYLRYRYGFSEDYWERYPVKVNAVSAVDVQAVAQKYLSPERAHVVAVGDAAHIRPAFEKLGKVESQL